MSEHTKKTVQRYKEYRDAMADCHCDVEEDGVGDFVLYDDYAKLEAECAALREALKAIADDICDNKYTRIARDALKAAGEL